MGKETGKESEEIVRDNGCENKNEKDEKTEKCDEKDDEDEKCNEKQNEKDENGDKNDENNENSHGKGDSTEEYTEECKENNNNDTIEAMNTLLLFQKASLR